ncbi:MAG: hypothetical protein FWF08_06615, partial [Oscillospiraceae bacterium]|nr:hypothetical protein [Oscillospiraceae bacterium]
MKKAALILSCAVIALSLAFGGHTVYMIKNPPHVGQRDRLSDDADNGYNLNMIMQARPENWKKIIGSPALSESEMPKLDGSTSTAAITAELFRQFFDYGDGKIAAQIWHTSEYEAYGNLIEQGTYIDGTYEKDSSKGLIFAPHPSDYYIRYAKEKGVELEIAPIA